MNYFIANRPLSNMAVLYLSSFPPSRIRCLEMFLQAPVAKMPKGLASSKNVVPKSLVSAYMGDNFLVHAALLTQHFPVVL
ncbi:hypothetical protein A359_04770 [secondary endosymbiont of Ctenarytaina eucalypti]|uniref:Uncharacterized protein n=2 Tax=secondary endosymbiont of Ctenarytaina eucalypti TaxID=1199245 RepID=J3TXH8_9ENTR|nr:hypothetical protein A359_04770 [secondary endosymbiont of Ctenarytaina eucalypti]